MISKSKEDYLNEIYSIQFCNNRAAKISEIANAMKVSKPSVSEMIRKLAKEGLLQFEAYKGVTLTKKGVGEARKVVRKHRLLEVFFSQLLKIKNKFHKEAHKVEHEISEEVSDKLDQLLKKPNICPDGNPIPSKKTKVMELDEVPVKSEVKILFTKTSDSSSLEQLNSMGIVPTANTKVIRKIPKGPIILSIKGSEVALGPKICSKIFVELK